MTEQEYVQEKQRIKQMEHDLTQRYIKSNTKVPAPNYVKLNGEVLYLKMYTVLNGNIYPTLYPLSKNGKPYYVTGKVYRKNWQEMKLYKPKQQ